MSLNPCKIPSAVTISGIRWKVREVSQQDFIDGYEGKDNVEDYRFYGRSSPVVYEIWLDESLPPLAKWRTFVHELIHAVQDSSGQSMEDEEARSLEVAMAWLLNRGNWEYE